MVDVHIKYLEHFVDLAGAVAVEVGCRHKEFLRGLGRRKALPIGIHFSAQPPFKPSRTLRLYHGSGDALPLADDSADLLVYLSSFHHIPAERQKPALQEVIRVLRPGGRLHVVEPFSEGSYFDLLKLIDDQTEVRARALDSLSTAWSLGLKPIIAGSYIHVERFATFDDFRSRVIAINPAREKAFAVNERQVREVFTRHGVVEDDGRVLFRQPCRMYHFSRQAQADRVA